MLFSAKDCPVWKKEKEIQRIRVEKRISFPEAPQWGAADAEIKVPSGENTELKRSPFKAWSRSIYSHTCYAYCQGFFLAYFYPSGPFTCIFPQTSPDFSCIGCC